MSSSHSRLLPRLREVARQRGWPGALAIAIPWSIAPWYRVEVRDLSAVPAEPPALPPEWREETLRRTDLARVRDFHPGLSAKEIERRWREGSICTLGWVGERLAHFRWDSDRDCHLDFLSIQLCLAPGDHYTSFVYTHPDFRGYGLHSTFLLRSIARARERGLSRTIALVAEWNLVARHVSARHAGRKLVGWVGLWRLGPLRALRVGGAVRRVGTNAIAIAPDAPPL